MNRTDLRTLRRQGGKSNAGLHDRHDRPPGRQMLQPFLFEDRRRIFSSLAHRSSTTARCVRRYQGPRASRHQDLQRQADLHDLGEFFRSGTGLRLQCQRERRPTRRPKTSSADSRRARRGRTHQLRGDGGEPLRQGRCEIGYPYGAVRQASRRLPMPAPPAIAARILQRLQKLSEPLGTNRDRAASASWARRAAVDRVTVIAAGQCADGRITLSALALAGVLSLTIGQ